MFLFSEIQTVPQQIADSIKKAIYAQKLKPADKLPPQEELAETFGVSRPTVREALQLLQDEGFIKKTKKGYEVSRFHPDNIFQNIYHTILLSLTYNTLTLWDLFEVRRMIEIPVAGLAAERRTNIDLSRLKFNLPREDQLYQNPERIVQLDLQFHLTLAEASHNPLAKSMVESIVSVFKQITPTLHQKDKEKIVKDLPKVYEAVEKRDRQKAIVHMEQHLNNFVDYFKLEI